MRGREREKAIDREEVERMVEKSENQGSKTDYSRAHDLPKIFFNLDPEL